MVRAAARLMQTRGYQATGLSDVIEESQAPRGSFYYYFPGGKEQLVLEAIEHAGGELEQVIRSGFARARDSSEAAECLAEMARYKLERSNFRRGCPVALLSLETAAQPGPISASCVPVFLMVQGLFEEVLRKDGFPEEEARELALYGLVGLEGAFLLGIAFRSSEPMRVYGRQLSAHYAAHRQALDAASTEASRAEPSSDPRSR